MAASNRKTVRKWLKQLTGYFIHKKGVLWVLKNFKIGLLHDPAIPLLGINPKKLKAESQRDLYTYVHGSISHNSEKVEAT